jgi:hypothetical protein
MAHEICHEMLKTRGVDRHQLAYSAVLGAENALARIEEIVTKHSHVSMTHEQFIELQWRVRSFFWELVGAWDLFQQWVNDTYLRYDEDKVSMNSIRQAIENGKGSGPGWKEVSELLLAAFESDWHFEIRTYRNYGHRSYFQMTNMIQQNTGRNSLFLPCARKGQNSQFKGIVPHLKYYIERMREIGQKIAEIRAAPEEVS